MMSPLWQIRETNYVSLGVNAHSGMPAPLIGGVTTRKEFKAITEAIGFIKAMDYPLTPHLVKELADIADGTYNNRTKSLIEAMITLQQFADDAYSLTRGRTVYGDAGDQCLLDKYGTLIPGEQIEIQLVKNLSALRTDTSENSIWEVWFTSYIDSTYGVNETSQMEILLSDTFIESISRYNPFSVLNRSNLEFYLIEPMQHKPMEVIGDPRWEKLSIRLTNAILFGSGSDKIIAVDPVEQSFKDMLGSITGYLLKKHRIESGHKLRKTSTIETLGKHLINIYIKSVSGGGHIHGRSTSLDYLNKRTTTNLVPKLFKKVSKWKTGGYSIAYEPLEDMTNIVFEAFDAFMRLPVKEVDDATVQTFDNDPNIENFDRNVLHHINIKDKVFLMSRIVGYSKNKYYFTINAVDRQASRVYSTITAIQSIAREYMGFHNHDISAAQTAICLQLVNDASKYPLHQQMIRNKRKFRAEIEELTGWDYDQVKKELSALDNGQSINMYNRKVKHALAPFFDESRALMEDVLNTVKHKDPVIYAQAILNSKDTRKDGEVIGKKLSSIYFFVWTQYERKIRDAMKTCFTKPAYDCHDAVYSREKIDFDHLKNIVFEKTGFSVGIEA